MTTAAQRWLIFLLAGVFVAGCQSLPGLQDKSLTEAEFFARGLDQYIAAGDLQTLQRLPQEYPDGPWGPRAELVVKLAGQQDKCVADKEQMTAAKTGGQKQQTSLKDKDLSRCLDETAVLKQNNQELEQTIEQLKKLLIDMEARSN